MASVCACVSVSQWGWVGVFVESVFAWVQTHRLNKSLLGGCCFTCEPLTERPPEVSAAATAALIVEVFWGFLPNATFFAQ